MKMLVSSFAVATFTVFFAASGIAFADVSNKKTKLTFSGPVEVPGATLSPGTYVFKLVDSQSDRHIVQVTNERENKVFATVMAINDYRVNPASKTVILFGEQTPGTAVPVKAWFYPGDNYGQRFIYPKKKAETIAVAYKEPVPHIEEAHHDSIEETAKVAPVPVMVSHPAAPEPKPYTAAAVQPTDSDDKHGHAGEVVQEAPAPKPLPRTASNLQLNALLGGLLVALAFFLRSKKAKT